MRERKACVKNVVGGKKRMVRKYWLLVNCVNNLLFKR